MLQNWVDIGLFGALPTYLTMWYAFDSVTVIANCTQARCMQRFEPFNLLYSMLAQAMGKPLHVVYMQREAVSLASCHPAGPTLSSLHMIMCCGDCQKAADLRLSSNLHPD